MEGLKTHIFIHILWISASPPLSMLADYIRLGHSNLDTPVPVRSLKLSKVWLCKYSDG